MYTSPAAERSADTETTNRSTDARCAQCGERLVLERNKARPDGSRSLCVDCAFDAIPFTD